MKILLMSLLFFFRVEEVLGVECVYCEDSLDWSWSNVNWSELEEEVKGLEVSDYDESKNELCRVEIYFDYRSNQSSISFGDSFPWSELNQGELRLDYLIRLQPEDEEGDEFYNVLEYACADSDHCERKILFSHLQWLTQIDYSLFHHQLHLLFFSQSNSTVVDCLTDKKMMEKCSTGSCSGRYSTSHESVQSECSPSGSSSPWSEVHLTVNMIFNEVHQLIRDAKILRYICHFDQCNDRSFTDKFIDLVNNYFPLQPMRDAFQRPFLKEQSDDNPSPPSSSSSFSPPVEFVRPSREKSVSFTFDDLVRRNAISLSSRRSIDLRFFLFLLALLFVNVC